MLATTPRSRRILRAVAFATASAIFLFIFATTAFLYQSQVKLQNEAEERQLLKAQRRVEIIEQFFREQHKLVTQIATSREISDYLSNVDLGMSDRYGLNASLSFIDNYLSNIHEHHSLSGEPIFRTVKFINQDGVTASASRPENGLDAKFDYHRAEPLTFDAKDSKILFVAPIMFKGSVRGAIQAISNLEILVKILPDEKEDHTTNLLFIENTLHSSDENQYQLANKKHLQDLALLPPRKLTPVSLRVQDRLANFMALRVALNDERISIVTLIPETDVFGQFSSPFFAFGYGGVATLLVAGAIALERMRRRAKRLEDEFLESDRVRAELARHNRALADEIERREQAEADLRLKTIALNRSNGELRIAAAAFEKHEGMVVTDKDGVILRANRAFCLFSGFDEPQLVGKSLSAFHAQSNNGEFYHFLQGRRSTSDENWRGDVYVKTRAGDICERWLSYSVVRDESGDVINYIGTYYDISDKKKAEARIKDLAFFDQLTGLPNRTLLFERMRNTMNANARNGVYGALLFLDLDNFKMLNDTLGHHIGDILLKQAAQRLLSCVGPGDTVARLGGDEFVVLLANLGTENADEAAIHAELIGARIQSSFIPAYHLEEYEYPCTPSIGIALFAGNDVGVDELLKRADLAMYDAKAVGRNTLRFFDPGLQAAIATRAALENDLRDDLKTGNFLLFYQPQVDRAGQLIGAEALVRWPHASRGMVSPGEFIPVAESTGLILPLGTWILETACRQLAAWARNPSLASLTLSVNVSALQIRQNDFAEQVLEVLKRTNANPQRLKLELTESTLVNNIEGVIEKMSALRDAGIRFSLDDFGTGYSSMSYLKRLPLDQLKIDRSFVNDVLVDDNDAAIARSIITLAKTLGLSVIAEGVEQLAQCEFLIAEGCDAFQGYYFSRPLPAPDFVTFATRLRLQPRASLQIVYAAAQ